VGSLNEGALDVLGMKFTHDEAPKMWLYNHMEKEEKEFWILRGL
jgi:hypothetical protein